MSRTKFFYFAKVILLFVLYFVTAKFGLNLQAVSRFATLIWIPTGLSLTILFLYGRSLWPAIFLGAFLVNVTNGAPVFVALGIAIGNTLEAVIGFYILNTFLGYQTSLNKLKDILILILLAAPISTAISATFGVTSLLLGHVITSSVYFKTWTPWWIGDLISDLVLAPFFIFWLRKIPFVIKPLRFLEFILLVLSVLGIGFSIFMGVGSAKISTTFPMRYLVYPPIIWASIRFGQREVATIMLLFSALAIYATILGFGPYDTKNISENLLFLQFFMIITSITSLILAVVVSEKRELEERKDDFITMASHELRTPVTTLKLYSEVVNKKLTEKKYVAARNYLTKLDSQIYKMGALLIDLLDVSRIQSGKLIIKKELFNINDLLFETTETLQKTTNNHKLIIKGRVKYEILGDRERVYQVLVNLIANAIKYSPEGGRIIVYCKHLRNAVQISIQDKGIGIDKSHLRRIFEKLYRVPDQNGKTYPGLGIGLFVCAEIIKMHKGKIWVESNKTKGATFHFTLPVYPTLRVNKSRRLLSLGQT